MPKKKIDYASLYTLRKDGRYVGSYTDDTGRHYIYDRDPERLWHKLNDPAAPTYTTFRNIAEAWKDAVWDVIRDGTKSCYEAPLSRAINLFGDIPAKEIKTIELQNHLLALKTQGLSASTIKAQRVVYSQIFQHAIVDPKYSKEIFYNPAAPLKIPPGTKKAKKREAPEDDIVNKIKENAETAYFGLFAFFLICTGFRRGEALAITWSDIDFDADTIQCTKKVSCRTGTAKIEEPKTENGTRTIPLLPPLKAILHKPKGAKQTDYVFYGEDASKPMPQSTYNRRWMHYCKDMGFVTDDPEERISKQKKKYIVHHYKPTLTAHVMRHGYATMLFEADVDVYTAQKYMGHADVETTIAVYTHLRQRKKEASTSRLMEYASTNL